MVHSLRRPIYSLVLAAALAIAALFVGLRGVQAEKSAEYHGHGSADTGDHALRLNDPALYESLGLERQPASEQSGPIPGDFTTGGFTSNNVEYVRFLPFEEGSGEPVPGQPQEVLSATGANIRGDYATSGHTVGNNNGAGANVIAFNGLDGVVVFVCSTCTVLPTGNSIQRSSIFENGQLGIELDNDGVTANDPKDPDTGPNQLQNYPVLTAATTFSGETTIKGKLNSKPNKTFTLRFFSNPPAADEGKRFKGQKDITTDSNGDVLAFAFKPAQAVKAGG